MKRSTKKMVLASILTALVCVATMVIKIPSPMKGYLNLGDCMVLLCSFLLSPTLGFLAAGLGSALADLFLGYVTYVPATFLIKGLMALLSHGIFRSLSGRSNHVTLKRILSSAAAELWMILGYFLFEGCLYGFAPSVVNVPANAVQALVGLVLGVLLMSLFEKSAVLRGGLIENAEAQTKQSAQCTENRTGGSGHEK